MGERVVVKFHKDYVAARGAGIAGAKGSERTLAMSDDLRKLVETGVVSVVRKVPAKRRETATNKNAEKPAE